VNEARQTHENHIDTKSAISFLADILIGMMAVYVVHAVQEVVQDDVITFRSSRSRRRGLVALLWTGVAVWQMSSYMTKGFKLLG
jgi:ABC-type nickel/cobalt efflux system permease component RcnA